MHTIFSKGVRYAPISESDDPEHRVSTEKSWLSSSSTTKNVSKKVVLGTLVILLVAVSCLTWLQSLESLSGHELPCGTSAREARARGCVFELTGSSWVTPECYDPVTEQEFLDFEDWHYYKDYNYTEEVPISEVRRGNGNGYFVHHDYHQAHCGFLLKKLHRAVNNGKKVDGLIKSVAHTTHCVEWMLNPPKDRFKLPQFAYTKFPNCGKEGGFNLDGAILKPESVNGINFVDTHSLPGWHHHHEPES